MYIVKAGSQTIRVVVSQALATFRPPLPHFPQPQFHIRGAIVTKCGDRRGAIYRTSKCGYRVFVCGCLCLIKIVSHLGRDKSRPYDSEHFVV